MTATTQAFANGEDAASASQVKAGFAITKEADLWFALAYPHVSFILDGHADEEPADDATWFQRCTSGYHQHAGVLATPRAVAFRQLRAGGCPKVLDGYDYSADFHAALSNGDPLTIEEAKLSLENYLEYKQDIRWGLPLLFEALYGPDALLEVLVPLVAGAAPSSVGDKHLNYYASALAPVLRRATSESAGAARNQLEQVYGLTTPEQRSNAQSFAAHLGCSIGGSHFAKEHAHRLGDVVGEVYLEWSEDDPNFVAEQALAAPLADPFVLYPRLVFIAGDVLFERYQKVVAKQKDAWSHGAAVEMMGRIRSLSSARMLVWLATKSKAKKAATTWLKDNKAAFQPLVAQLAASDEQAQALAKKLKW